MRTLLKMLAMAAFAVAALAAIPRSRQPGSPAAEPELKAAVKSEATELIALGANCYVDDNGRHSLFTEEEIANVGGGDPLDSSQATGSHVKATTSFYEQTQLKNCLA